MAKAPLTNEKVLFTYKIFSKSGLTDQLDRFRLCYHLGRSLGYQYIHSSFDLPRSSNQLDEFLGFNEYFKIKLKDMDLEKVEFIDIDLFDLFKEKLFDSLNELQDYIKQIVTNVNPGGKRIVVRLTLMRNVKEFVYLKGRYLVPNSKNSFFKGYLRLARFLLNKKTVNRLFQKQHPPAVKLSKWFNIQANEGLNFNTIFFQARNKNPWRSRFTGDGIKVLVHVRQGDVAMIETPWKTFIPLKRKQGIKKYREYDNAAAVRDFFIHLDDYYRFLLRLFDHFNPAEFSVIVSSDGYRRGFKRIYANMGHFNFSEDQVRKLRDGEKSYDGEKFARFANLENTLCLIGETDENLFDLIYSALTADIIVIGTQMHMIPKFLKLFPNLDNPPILVVLYREEEFKKGWTYPHLQPLDGGQAKIISIKSDTMDMTEVIAKIGQELRKIK